MFSYDKSMMAFQPTMSKSKKSLVKLGCEKQQEKNDPTGGHGKKNSMRPKIKI